MRASDEPLGLADRDAGETFMLTFAAVGALALLDPKRAAPHLAAPPAHPAPPPPSPEAPALVSAVDREAAVAFAALSPAGDAGATIVPAQAPDPLPLPLAPEAEAGDDELAVFGSAPTSLSPPVAAAPLSLSSAPAASPLAPAVSAALGGASAAPAPLMELADIAGAYVPAPPKPAAPEQSLTAAPAANVSAPSVHATALAAGEVAALFSALDAFAAQTGELLVIAERPSLAAPRVEIALAPV